MRPPGIRAPARWLLQALASLPTRAEVERLRERSEKAEAQLERWRPVVKAAEEYRSAWREVRENGNRSGVRAQDASRSLVARAQELVDAEVKP